MSNVQRFAYTFGAIYMVVGIAGFFVTGFENFAGTDGEKLVLFGVNPLHNFVHVAIGVLWVSAAAREATARTISLVLGAALLLLGVIGLFMVGSDANILAVNHADNLLHIATAALALYFSLSGRSIVATAKEGG